MPTRPDKVWTQGPAPQWARLDKAIAFLHTFRCYCPSEVEVSRFDQAITEARAAMDWLRPAAPAKEG